MTTTSELIISRLGSTEKAVSKLCFNVIYEDDNQTIPEIDNYDLLYFGLYFMKIFEREIQKSEPDFKILNF